MYAIQSADDGSMMHLTDAETERAAITDLHALIGCPETIRSLPELRLTELTAEQYSRACTISYDSEMTIEYVEVIRSGAIDRVGIDEIVAVDLGEDINGGDQVEMRVTDPQQWTHSLLFQFSSDGKIGLADENETDSRKAYIVLAAHLGGKVGHDRRADEVLNMRPELVEPKAAAIEAIDAERHRRAAA